MDDKEKMETLKESKILEALSHPNIVQFREVYKTKKGKLCIVMEYADGKKYIYLSNFYNFFPQQAVTYQKG